MRFWNSCWIAPAAFAIDMVTKRLARNVLRGNMPVTVTPSSFRFNYVENTGAAFGAFSEEPVLLLILTGTALFALFVFLILNGDRLSHITRASLWLLVGGAAGNYYDRLVYGYVVDFIEITRFHFPVFNFADMCVVTSILLLAGCIILRKEDIKNV